MRKDLGGFRIFKIQLVPKLKPNDLLQRRSFGEWALRKLAKIHFCTEKLCSTTKLIFRFWSEDLPKELQKLPMHPEKVTLWSGLWAGGIIGPYFFKDAANRNVTVNGERYREMISNFFCPKCKNLTCMTCGFKKTVPHATQHAQQGTY